MARSWPVRACATSSMSSNRSSSSAGVISSDVRSCSIPLPRELRVLLFRLRGLSPFLAAGGYSLFRPYYAKFLEANGGWCPPRSSKPVGRAIPGRRVRFPSASAKGGDVPPEARALSHPPTAPPLAGGFDSRPPPPKAPREAPGFPKVVLDVPHNGTSCTILDGRSG